MEDLTKAIDGKFHFTDSIVLGNDDGSEQPSEGEGYYTMMMMMMMMTRKKEERKTNVEAVLGSRMNWSCALALLTKRKKRENDKWTENRKK